MLEIEIDGKTVSVANGSTVMDAANQLGVYIPHFCYHKKLSIAANCRMCLVEVEKAPKPLPACATPATAGMKVRSHSDYAVKAQKDVMEFLLINHPLDCPICDQGGECALQDLSVGYGGGESRYQEAKRVVSNKNLGSLISTDMTRCIQCTRCVRFGQEISGIMELGMAFRGEHSEIMTFVERTVDSELSGNMIDLCPVGALTSKPFRYSARSWELSRRKSVSPHCGLGSNLSLQTRNHRVMRVLPLENESVNECWISDKDRFSYEGLNSSDRLERPMIKQDGQWREVEWKIALDYVARALKDVKRGHGADAIGALASPHSTFEELYLLQKMVRGVGSDNVDFRLRQSDFSADGKRAGAPWLGMRVSEISQLDRVLVVGSFLAGDHPLIAQRLRQAAKGGCEVSLLNPTRDQFRIKTGHCLAVRPDRMLGSLGEIVKAACEIKGAAVPDQLAAAAVSDAARGIAQSLCSGKNVAVLLGNLALNHPDSTKLQLLAQQLGETTGARFGFLGEAANSVGGYLARAVPFAGELTGMNARQMLQQPRKAYLLFGAEVDLDCANSAQALAAMEQAELVVAFSAFRHRAIEYADVMLPIAPFSETSGTFVSTEGRVQSFAGAVKARGESRPGWKVLRVLGNMLDLSGFDFESSEQVLAEALAHDGFASGLDNRIQGVAISLDCERVEGLQRVAHVPIYSADSVVRRAESLQKSRLGAVPTAAMNSGLMQKLGVQPGDLVRVSQAGGEASLAAACDDRLADDCVQVAASHNHTSNLGAMFGAISVERM